MTFKTKTNDDMRLPQRYLVHETLYRAGYERSWGDWGVGPLVGSRS